MKKYTHTHKHGQNNEIMQKASALKTAKATRKNPTKRNKEVNNNFFFSQVLAYTYLFIYFPNLTSPISISYHGKPSGYSEQS